MMKTTFSRVVALSLLASVLVSVPSGAKTKKFTRSHRKRVTPSFRKQITPNDIKLAGDSAAAIGYIGQFFQKMNGAGEGRAHVIRTRTLYSKGKVLYTTALDTQTSWTTLSKSDDEMDIDKFVSQSTLITTRGLQTTSKKFTELENGSDYFLFDEKKNIWSKRKDNEASPMSDIATANAYFYVLASFSAGNRIDPDETSLDRIVVRDGPKNTYVIDVESGNLLTWTLIGANSTTEYRWVKVEPDVTVDESLFEWKIPEGSTQVTSESMKGNYDLEILR